MCKMATTEPSPVLSLGGSLVVVVVGGEDFLKSKKFKKGSFLSPRGESAFSVRAFLLLGGLEGRAPVERVVCHINQDKKSALKSCCVTGVQLILKLYNEASEETLGVHPTK